MFLKSIGDGGHVDVTLDRGGDPLVCGRGDTTNIWVPLLSRAHVEFSLQKTDGKAEADEWIRVKVISRNSLVVLPGANTDKSFKLGAGEVVYLSKGDRLSLLQTGAYLYEVTSEEGRTALSEEEVLLRTPEREATDDEADILDIPELELEPADAPLARAAVSFTRIPSFSNDMPCHIDKAHELAAPCLPAAQTTAALLPSVPESDDTAPPPAKKAKVLPPCKYGAGCTRKNPVHFLEFGHPLQAGGGGGAAAPVAPPACKYGAGCTRQNKQHFLDFTHPPTPAAANQDTPTPAAPAATARAATPAPAAAGVAPSQDSQGDSQTPVAPAAAPGVADVDVTSLALRKTREKNGIVPLRCMPENEMLKVGTNGQEYHMKYTQDGYYCTCVAWRYQNKAVDSRTCKHLKMYLGEEFERKRCGIGSPDAHVTTKVANVAGVLLADKWDEKSNLTGWWVSEKLDGVRAYWDGENFQSRNGNIFTAPEWFTKGLPKNRHLDGELFGGRKKFQTTVSVVKSGPSHPGWSSITYEIFDVPNEGTKFETRMGVMNDVANACASHIRAVEQYKCTSNESLLKQLQEMDDSGGEGLMMRQPGSMYVRARSKTLLKAKKFCDCEAIVRGHQGGKGKNTDKMGALICELASGTQFRCGIGFTDEQRSNPPPVGTIITVKYQELTNGGIPRFPAYTGTRIDATWPPAQ